MYLVGDSFHVSFKNFIFFILLFKWVVIISTNQEAAHTQSAKVSTCYTLWHFEDWSLITGMGGYKTAGGGGASKVLPLQKRRGAEFFLVMLKWGGGGGGGHKR